MIKIGDTITVRSIAYGRIITGIVVSMETEFILISTPLGIIKVDGHGWEVI